MADLPPLYVLTCAPASRRFEAAEVLRIADPEHRILVTTRPDNIRFGEMNLSGYDVVTYEDTDINISKWWSMGLDWIATWCESTVPGPYDVLMIESDVRMSREDVDTVRRVMREQDCVLAAPDWQGSTGGEHKVRRDNSIWINEQNHRADYSRLPGMGMVTAGEKGLRHDPEFRWWLADDDFEWNARVNGGTVLVAGTTMHHEGTQGPLQGERLQAWHEDQAKFLAKWGGLPSNGGAFTG